MIDQFVLDTGRLFRHLLTRTTPAAEQEVERTHHLAPFSTSSGSFVMASPASHFDHHWANSLPGLLGASGLPSSEVAAAGADLQQPVSVLFSQEDIVSLYFFLEKV